MHPDERADWARLCGDAAFLSRAGGGHILRVQLARLCAGGKGDQAAAGKNPGAVQERRGHGCVSRLCGSYDASFAPELPAEYNQNHDPLVF